MGFRKPKDVKNQQPFTPMGVMDEPMPMPIPTPRKLSGRGVTRAQDVERTEERQSQEEEDRKAEIEAKIAELERKKSEPVSTTDRRGSLSPEVRKEQRDRIIDKQIKELQQELQKSSTQVSQRGLTRAEDVARRAQPPVAADPMEALREESLSMDHEEEFGTTDKEMEEAARIAAGGGTKNLTSAERIIQKQLGVPDVLSLDEAKSSVVKLQEQNSQLDSTKKQDWFNRRMEAFTEQLTAARETRDAAIARAESEAQRKEAILAWGQVADIIGKGLIQLGAAQHGLRTGYDLSGLKFDPINWDEKYARLDKALSRQINSAEKRFDEISKETATGVERLYKEKDVAEERTWREEQADKELKARKKIEEDRFNRQLEKLGMENEFAKAMEETKHQNRLEVEALKGQFKPGDRAGARQLRKSLQKKREAAESLKGENGFDLLQEALKSKKPADKDRFRKLLRDAGLEPVSTEEILDKADGWFSNDIEAYNEFLDKHIEENLSDANFSDMIEESPTGPAAPGADVIRADSAEDLDQLF